ncbi:MAG: DUF4384 domain-containing protein [Elusimicrobia bacterium]|nr:DUF4384 domain-containing protein [Elusimicrobiota bacterium]
MRRRLIWLPLFLSLAACHGRRESPALKPDTEAVKARAEQSFTAPAAAEGPQAPAGRTPVPPAAPAPAPAVPETSATVGVRDPKLGCTWVRAEAKVPVGGNESRDQARARAIEKALDSALRDLLGVEVNQRSLDFQQESLHGQTSLIESVLRTTRRGCIVSQRLLGDQYCDLGDCRDCGYHVDLKACIKERPADWDKDFLVELQLSRDRFVEGDEAKISVAARRDAYVYLYDVQMNSETSLIVPNEIMPEARLKAGQAWTYPDESAAQRGVRLVAQMPEGRPPISAETIRVVATKTPLPAKLCDPSRGGYLGVVQRLNAAGLEWAEDAAAFTISPAPAP